MIWPHGEDKIRTPIPMVDCRFAPNTNGAISHESLSEFRFFDGRPFQCPNTTEMILQGNLESASYAYIEVEISGCDLPEGECADLSEVDNHYMNLWY